MNTIKFQNDIAKAFTDNLRGFYGLCVKQTEDFYKVCPVCKEKKYGKLEIYIIKKEGECANCSHLRGDILEDRIND